MVYFSMSWFSLDLHRGLFAPADSIQVKSGTRSPCFNTPPSGKSSSRMGCTDLRPSTPSEKWHPASRSTCTLRRPCPWCAPCLRAPTRGPAFGRVRTHHATKNAPAHLMKYTSAAYFMKCPDAESAPIMPPPPPPKKSNSSSRMLHGDASKMDACMHLWALAVAPARRRRHPSHCRAWNRSSSERSLTARFASFLPIPPTRASAARSGPCSAPASIYGSAPRRVHLQIRPLTVVRAGRSPAATCEAISLDVVRAH